MIVFAAIGYLMNGFHGAAIAVVIGFVLAIVFEFLAIIFDC